MTEEPLATDGDDRDEPEEDDRFAAVLRGETSSQSLRQELAREQSESSEELIAGLDALDFVQQVVGDTADVPERIAEYRVRGLLGRGGMGTVYLARQEELERDVALKVLLPHYSADPTMRKRFRAEARATAALHHRHIVPIYDYGEAQGMLFFTMERVDGMSLDKHIAAARRVGRKPMQPLEAAHRFAGVADALGLAHRRRLLHRDVKPGNILVAADGTLALTDFGLAKALDRESARLTSKGGGFLGTLHYTSPEQALGAELTPASDLYSLGVTLFEAVAGELPFAARSTESLLQEILHGTPKRLRDAVPKVSRDLDHVVEKLLSREPSDRYQDGEALARDLLRIRDGEPVHIRRLPLHVRIYRRARKNPGLASAIAAACVLLIVTVALSAGLWREKGQSLTSRHENHLVQIANDIGNERGWVTGPVPLLQALTGITYSNAPSNRAVLDELDRAAGEVPGDSRVEAMRRAYVDDPSSEVSALLAEGRGYEALRLCDAAIEDATRSRTSGRLDLAVELRLYRLYLARGVANLCASVARVNEARTDLALASYLRPGATFPESLLDVLGVLDSAGRQGLAGALEELEKRLAHASSERVEVMAHLLWTAAGLRPLAGANLMSFDLGYPERRRLHEASLRLLGTPLGPTVARGEPTGLSGHLRDLAHAALERLADPSALRVLAERARREVARAVHPDALLRGWIGTLRLIEQPTQRGELFDSAGDPMPAAQQLAAWRFLLSLHPERDAAVLWLPRFEELRRNHGDLPGIREVAARLHVLAGSAVAPDVVARWIENADGDPAARLCRMEMRLRRADSEGAIEDAIVAVQQSVDPAAAYAKIAEICLAVSATAEARRRAEILEIRGRFLRFASASGSAEGGR